MIRQLYYYIIILGLIFFVLEFLLHGLLRLNIGLHVTNLNELKSLLALIIIIGETIKSKKTIQTTNIIFIVFSLFGLMFTIMHWPFGRLLFLIPILFIIVILFISSFKNRVHKLDTTIILAIPFARFLCTWTAISNFPGFGLLCIIEIIIMFLVLVVLGMKLISHRLDKKTE